MSAVSPTRPSRRAATRRKVIAESPEPSDDEGEQKQQRDEDSEEFTPAPARSTRSRRKTTDVTATPKTATRTRKTRTGDSVEPSQIFSPAESSIAADPVSPVKKPSPRKRQSVRAGRKNRMSITPDTPPMPKLAPTLPTPQASLSPEPSENIGTPLPTPRPSSTPDTRQRDATPLADITETIINERTPVPEKPKDVAKVDTKASVMEKPMDIVVRSRAAAMPLSSQEHAPPESRTVITYLVLTNFKSYAGRQEVGPFHASFSSVVGPNGSGKSNVIDSLLFVFGFRASKMRQGKISALIHNSAAFPDVDHCEVQVHFEEVKDLPNGGSIPVPDSALIISRKAFKNNASKYYINNKESNFTAVTTLLKGRGVDLDHKRFLILQGEVESIAQMKPKAANEHDDGLLEYLEDIIGTSKYKTPIEEAAAETETLNEICVEKSNRVQHVEKEKNALEDKKNKALAYIRDENELATKQSALYQILIKETNDSLQVTQEAAAQVQGTLEEELKKHEGNEEGIKQLEKQYKSGSKQFEALEKQTQAVLKEIAKLDKETVKFEEKKKFLANKQKKLEKTLETSKFSTKESETLIRQSTDDVERNTAQIAELEEDMKVEEKELAFIRESLKGKTQGLSDEIAAKQKSLEPWSAKINEKQSAMAVAQSELDILREKENSGAVAIAEVEAKIAAIEETKETKTTEFADCQKERKSLEKEFQRITASIAELGQKEPTMRSKLSGARQKADEARASLSATQTQGNSGRINGFHGRLGNLGAIDPKYDVAISTACPSLDNLVVDSVENNLGRANFILLDRLPNRDLSAIDTPENVPRLFDLVKSKEDKFLPAFYSVLQNTLVAKDLEHANRIAYGAKRWRVSGTMSGGGTRVAKGGMSSKLASDVTKDQVSKLEEFQQQQRDLDISLKEEQKITLELDSLERNVADARKRIQELGAEQTSSKSEKSRMSALIAKLRTETAGVEEEIKTLQDKIMEIGGVKFRGQKAKMSNADVARAKAEKQKELDSIAGDIEKVERDMKEHAGSASGSRQEAEDAQEALDTQKDALAAMKAELDAKTAELNSNRGIEIEMRNRLEEYQKTLASKQKELRHWQEKLSKLSLQNVDDLSGGPKAGKTEAENEAEKPAASADEDGDVDMMDIDDSSQTEQQEDQLETSQADMTTNPTTLLPTYTRDELADMDKSTLKASITRLEEKINAVSIDLSVLSDYRRRVHEHALRTADLASSLSARDASKSTLDSLRSLRLTGFMTGFSTISLRLKEMYQMITMGGNAELELVDSLDPFAEGILFSVMPPKKSWKNIGNLSGGEKTLSSLALVFALHHFRPTPVYVMDEIDAALDFRNVSIVASYIKERTKNAQFIVISLRNNMFELAARLVGVYKVNHMTKSVTQENINFLTGAAA
ncbi:RecF/RecN/SMC protein [Aulographum hederae CBS 113979]|uniref:Structural maintenance of chromosomes protein n=1 Tax=Aulographum hederae CBS 113979 TaxID=1176131 RepID=A0A6G1H532_9PEZI|nr:RecF/RecN/SMC protein [Aulographum hederae CBS 113979]